MIKFSEAKRVELSEPILQIFEQVKKKKIIFILFNFIFDLFYFINFV